MMDHTILSLEGTNKNATQKGSGMPHIRPEVISSLQDASGKASSSSSSSLFNELVSLIKTFNEHADGATASEDHVDQQLSRLNAIEQKAYTWQRQANANAHEIERAAMNALLMELEEHQRRLVKQSSSLWIKPAIKERDEKEMKRLWNSITTRSGNIRIDLADQEFVDFTLASIAKLLQGSHGRLILSTLDEARPSQDRIIWIGKNWQQLFANSAEKGWRPGSWAYASARLHNPEDTSHRRGGSGTGSYVQIDMAPSPPMVGLHDEPLCMPAFITLGHELGHAYHNLQGQSLDGVWLERENWPQGYPADKIEQRAWRDLEEYQNITQNENTLRGEHGLPARKYEIAITALGELRFDRKDALFARFEAAMQTIPSGVMERVKKSLPQLEVLDNIFTGLTEDDKPLWRAPGQLDKAEALLRELETQLPGVLQTIQQQPQTKQKQEPDDKCDVM